MDGGRDRSLKRLFENHGFREPALSFLEGPPPRGPKYFAKTCPSDGAEAVPPGMRHAITQSVTRVATLLSLGAAETIAIDTGGAACGF